MPGTSWRLNLLLRICSVRCEFLKWKPARLAWIWRQTNKTIWRAPKWDGRWQSLARHELPMGQWRTCTLFQHLRDRPFNEGDAKFDVLRLQLLFSSSKCYFICSCDGSNRAVPKFTRWSGGPLELENVDYFLIWKWGLYGGNQMKARLLGWTLTHTRTD